MVCFSGVANRDDRTPAPAEHVQPGMPDQENVDKAWTGDLNFAGDTVKIR